VRGAHEGEGLGNQFLSHIRETDAIVHVVRVHGDDRVVHPDGRVDPVADAEIVETELLFADLEQAERRLERVEKQARGGEKAARAEEAWLRDVIDALRAGQPARTVPRTRRRTGCRGTPAPADRQAGAVRGQRRRGRRRRAGGIGGARRRDRRRAVAVSARLEAELAALEPDEAAAMRDELGAGEPGLHRVVDGAFALLHQIAFFTADAGKPAQSRHLRRGLTAWDAAGEVHTDMQRGFVRAEVIAWDDLVAAGGYAAARERGTLRIEGRDYVVADGDVVHIRFTP
jgi:ribosome-binding ATPase YchF (GTP1/OBG family)